MIEAFGATGEGALRELSFPAPPSLLLSQSAAGGDFGE
jgi:hypothetical protein